MSFRGQTDAKRFIVGRIMQQAEMEGISLSEAERHMLSWSESDPDFTPELDLARRLEAEMSDADYETKVEGLIRRAFDREIAADRTAKSVYREARARLREGDHYISVMMEAAIGLSSVAGASSRGARPPNKGMKLTKPGFAWSFAAYPSVIRTLGHPRGLSPS
jgi:hypothetical protein